MPPPEPFDPDWVISPGETLRDWMEENGLSARTTAKACALRQVEVEGVLRGSRKITVRIAQRLQWGTQIPAQLWLNLERAYRDGLKAGKIDASG